MSYITEYSELPGWLNGMSCSKINVDVFKYLLPHELKKKVYFKLGVKLE